MVLNYHFEDIDFTRQRSEILDIKSENAQLKTKFKEYIKIYGIIFGFFLLVCLLGTKRSLKKVYIKSYRKSGTNLYINYINNKNKEKCILLDIFALELDEIREFETIVKVV